LFYKTYLEKFEFRFPTKSSKYRRQGIAQKIYPTVNLIPAISITFTK
jgi:hypothetical protein